MLQLDTSVRRLAMASSNSPLLAPGSTRSVAGQILHRSHVDCICDCPRSDSVHSTKPIEAHRRSNPNRPLARRRPRRNGRKVRLPNHSNKPPNRKRRNRINKPRPREEPDLLRRVRAAPRRLVRRERHLPVCSQRRKGPQRKIRSPTRGSYRGAAGMTNLALLTFELPRRATT